MKRKIVNFAATLSLIFCVATVAIWIRSYWSYDRIGWRTVHRGRTSVDVYFHGFTWSKGDFAIAFRNGVEVSNRQKVSSLLQENDGTHVWHRSSAPQDLRSEYHFNETNLKYKGISGSWYGFELEFSSYSKTGITLNSAEIGMPVWFLTLLAATLPSARMAKRIFRADRNSVLCRACGYNLTGNTSGVCPECGQPIARELPLFDKPNA